MRGVGVSGRIQPAFGRGIFAASLLLLAVLAVVSLFIGVRDVTPWGLLSGQSGEWQVFVLSRVPRLIAILCAGASASVVGLIMQQLARNKFVSPSTSGTVESASLGLLVATLLFSSATVFHKMLISFVFALAGAMIFLTILDRIRFKNVIFVPLIGIMFGNVISAITTFFAYRYDLIQSLNAWTTGSFASVLAGRYELLYVAVPVLLLAYLFADRFTVAGMGEDFATNLGLHYRQVLTIGLTLVALSTAATVLTVGIIPFLGLIVPNVVSIVLGDNVRKVLPYTAVSGATLVLVCDIVGRTIRAPYEIPIGLIVGVVGGAVFLYLILRQGRHAAQ